MSFLLKMVTRPTSLPTGCDWADIDPAELYLINAAMWWLRDILFFTGALDVADVELPAWPPGDDGEMDDWRAEDIRVYMEDEAKGLRPKKLKAGRPTDKERDAYRIYREARQKTISARSKKHGKVLAAKFCTCDGWLVHSDEATLLTGQLRDFAARFIANPRACLDRPSSSCPAAAAAKIRDTLAFEPPGDPAYVREDDLKLIDKFALFNEVASRHGGYLVE